MTSRLAPPLLLVCLVLVASNALSQKKVPMPTAPKGFGVTIFAKPPKVNYPVCLSAAPTGELFVGIDKQGSLGKKPGDGRVVRCIDTNGDGVADQINTFAKMDHPRGLIYDNGKLWVLHPPYLTLYHDTDSDGAADKSETLIEGITTNFLKKRGADHTTNGIRMGIDGWIYISVGDFGFVKAKGKDGTTLTLKGGGVVRVRPDGSEMEIFARGLRNILDVCIDPQLNMFTRDNTNDGGGWDIRLSHILQTADYGYPSLFRNFADEIMPPLADYGGGSGCGAMFLSEPYFPKPFRSVLLTCDWGRSAVYYHSLTASGASFKTGQEVFSQISRPTDIDVDGSGRLYISSWHGGQFKYKGENIGFVAQVKPRGLKPAPFPDLTKLTPAKLLLQLQSPSHVRRLHAQREILRRGESKKVFAGLVKLMHKGGSPDVRVAAVFTLKQLYGARANPELVKLAMTENMCEFALRALTDRKSQLDGVPLAPFLAALASKNPRLQVAALIGLGRLGKIEAAKHVLPLARFPKSKNAARAQPAAYRSGKVKAKKSVKINAQIKDAKKLFLVVTDGGNGIGLDHAAWVEPLLTGPKGKKKLTDIKWTSAKAGFGRVHINRDCEGKPLRFRGKAVKFGIGTHAHSVIEYELPKGYTKFRARGVLDDGNRGGGMVRFYVFTDVLPGAYRKAGAAVVQDISQYVVPHIAVKTLVQLNAVDVCLKGIDGPDRNGALHALRYMHRSKAVKGLINRLAKATDNKLRYGLLGTLTRLYHKEAEYTGTWWGTRPDTSGPYYHRATWQESPRIERVLRKALLTSDSQTVDTLLTQLNRHRVVLKGLPPNLAAKAKKRDIAPAVPVSVPEFDPNNPKQIGNNKLAFIVNQVAKIKGDVKRGATLFRQQSCHACHTVASGERPIGPPLMDIGKRYNRRQLAESILTPSAQIAQGFASTVFVMKNGKVHTGFVIRKAADELEIRTSKGESLLLPTKMIDRQIASKQSIMPDGLVNNLTASDLAALIAYLESLRTE